VRNAYRIVDRKSRCSWEDNIRMNVKGSRMGSHGLDATGWV